MRIYEFMSGIKCLFYQIDNILIPFLYQHLKKILKHCTPEILLDVNNLTQENEGFIEFNNQTYQFSTQTA